MKNLKLIIDKVLEMSYSEFVKEYPDSPIDKGERSVDFTLHYVEIDTVSLFVSWVDFEIVSISIIDKSHYSYLKDF